MTYVQLHEWDSSSSSWALNFLSVCWENNFPEQIIQSHIVNLLVLAKESVRQDLLGVMVWYASVRNGFQYEISWDASTSQESMQAYVSMMSYLNNNMAN